MSDAPPRTHNLPPDIKSVLDPQRVAELIEQELDAAPLAADGTRVPSIRDRDVQLVQMCRRFLKAYPRIEDEEAERIATEVLHTCARFAGDSGRVEKARQDFKAPVLAAGKQIDEAFGNFGQDLIVRPLTGPPRGRRIAPLTLAEQIANRLIEKKEADADRQRRVAAAEVERLEREAQVARDLAAKGSATVGADDIAEAEAAAGKQQEIAAAPMSRLTRTLGNPRRVDLRKRVRTFEITDSAAVPRHLCSPDERLIRAFLGPADTPIPTVAGISVVDRTDLNRR